MLLNNVRNLYPLQKTTRESPKVVTSPEGEAKHLHSLADSLPDPAWHKPEDLGTGSSAEKLPPPDRPMSLSVGHFLH